MEDSTKPDWYTPEEAARRLKVSLWTIYRGIRDGGIPHRKVGSQYRIPASWVDEGQAAAGA